MIKNIKIYGKLSAAMIFFTAVIFINNPSWAWGTFADYPAYELMVIEVNVDAETVSLQSPDGETATLTVGDVVGQENYTIIAVKEWMVELESLPDDGGATIKSCIPVEQIVIIGGPLSEP